MKITYNPLGTCGTEIPAATSNGSVSTYLDTPYPAPASLARNFSTSARHYFSDRF